MGEDSNKDERINIRVTAEQKRDLERRAGGYPLSSYLVQAGLSGITQGLRAELSTLARLVEQTEPGSDRREFALRALLDRIHALSAQPE